MAQLFLPAEHTDADVVLAGQIAESIDSAELYVTWSPGQGHAAPEVVAELRDPEPAWTDTPAPVLQALRELWALLRRRDPRAPRIGARRAVDVRVQPRSAHGEAA